MTSIKSLGSGWLCSALITLPLIAACNRGSSVPAGQSQAATPEQATNSPMSVKGCLRAGEASDTYVLTTARAEGEQTATYQLRPMEGVSLADHVGRQIEVSGVMTTQQEVVTQSGSQPADKASGTAGRPTVSTATELDVRKLDVHKVQRLDDKCPDER